MLFPKPEKRKTVKGRERRKAREVVQNVREKCVARDGPCRIAGAVFRRPDGSWFRHRCGVVSEWCHLASHRRSKTRGQDAAERHTTAGSLMLCRTAHAQYDGRQYPRLDIVADERGADGPLAFVMDGATYEETA